MPSNSKPVLEQVGPLIGVALSVEYKSTTTVPVVQPRKSQAWVGAVDMHALEPASENNPTAQAVQFDAAMVEYIPPTQVVHMDDAVAPVAAK